MQYIFGKVICNVINYNSMLIALCTGTGTTL